MGGLSKLKLQSSISSGFFLDPEVLSKAIYHSLAGK